MLEVHPANDQGQVKYDEFLSDASDSIKYMYEQKDPNTTSKI